jgi:hypothetical protein
MLIYIIVGSVREGRTAIKVANWVQQAISELALNNLQTEIVDLKEWDLPLFAGAHPPATGIYDQPKQQLGQIKLHKHKDLSLLALNITMAIVQHSRMPWIMSVKNGKANLQLLSAMVQPMAHVQLAKFVK